MDAKNKLFINKEEWGSKISNFRRIEFNAQKGNAKGNTLSFDFLPQPSFNKNFELFIEKLKENK